MAETHLLEIRNLQKYYENILCLDDVSFDLNEGELLAIIGENASSKTTLMRVISGETPADGGSVSIRIDGGKSSRIRSAREARKYGIAVLHETSNIYENFSAAENIFFGSYNKVNPGKTGGMVFRTLMNQKARRLCDRFSVEIDARVPSKSLSLEQRQIASLLNAYVSGARLLLIDNAFSALSKRGLDKVMNIIRELKARRTAVVFFSHSLEFISKLADSVIIIEDGRVSEKRSYSFCDISNAFSKFKISYPKLSVSKGETALVCRRCSYKNVIREASFELARGEIIGIIGAQGAGKTTLARLLIGDLRLSGGVIEVNGAKAEFKSPADARARRVSAVMDGREKCGLIPALDLSNNLLFPNFEKQSSAIFRRALVSRSYIRRRAKRAVQKLNIRCDDVSQDVRTLSAGNRQKVLIARGIISDSLVYVFDEPSNGVDIAGRIQIYNLFNELRLNQRAVILLTSDISEAMGVCDRVLVMNRGSLTAEYERKNMSEAAIFKSMYPNLSDGV